MAGCNAGEEGVVGAGIPFGCAGFVGAHAAPETFSPWNALALTNQSPSTKW
jgi:hypothetical protein